VLAELEPVRGYGPVSSSIAWPVVERSPWWATGLVDAQPPQMGWQAAWVLFSKPIPARALLPDSWRVLERCHCLDGFHAISSSQQLALSASCRTAKGIESLEAPARERRLSAIRVSLIQRHDVRSG